MDQLRSDLVSSLPISLLAHQYSACVVVVVDSVVGTVGSLVGSVVETVANL